MNYKSKSALIYLLSTLSFSAPSWGAECPNGASSIWKGHVFGSGSGEALTIHEAKNASISAAARDMLNNLYITQQDCADFKGKLLNDYPKNAITVCAAAHPGFKCAVKDSFLDANCCATNTLLTPEPTNLSSSSLKCPSTSITLWSDTISSIGNGDGTTIAEAWNATNRSLLSNFSLEYHSTKADCTLFGGEWLEDLHSTNSEFDCVPNDKAGMSCSRSASLNAVCCQPAPAPF